MDRFFNSDNPFWIGMGRVFDIFVLNTLWLIFCLPIVTIGPSTSAFYYAMINLMNDEEHYVSHDFFYFFKTYFRKMLKTGLFLTAVDLFLITDVYMCYRSGTGIYTFFMVFFAIILLIMFFVTIYTYALASKLADRDENLLMWAFIYSIQHIFKSILMLLLFIVGIWFCHLMPGLIFIVPGMIGSMHASIFLSIFKRHFQDE